MRFLQLKFILFSILISAQENLPTDYLSSDFHKSRREALRAKMPANSVAVFFANPVRNRANDVDYVYHQDPNFYYLTGYKEPNAVLVIFKDETPIKDITTNEILYVQEKNEQAEMWTGKRLGAENAVTQLGLQTAFNGKDFLDSKINFEDFEKVLFLNFHNDYRDSKRNTADMFDLVKSFKTQANYDETAIDLPIKTKIYETIKVTPIENSANVAQGIGRALEYYPELKEDKILVDYANSATDAVRKELRDKLVKIEAETPKSNLDSQLLESYMAELREIKTPEEMKLLTKAVKISAQGQIEVMKAMKPNMSETEIQGIHEYVYKKYGSEYEGYPSIVGAGENGCVLHYIENTKTKVDGDLVLMDLGAEYHGYTADVTRTIPASGKFTLEQRAIYDVVYKAQEEAIKACVKGASFGKSNAVSRKNINKGLAELGIIATENTPHNYLPHGVSHYIGLDVHDPGTYGKLRVNSVITVEPGIYIPKNSPCDKKWWGIAVRIEDDILITEQGPVNLSASAPRQADEIEAMMKKSSPLDKFNLPIID